MREIDREREWQRQTETDRDKEREIERKRKGIMLTGKELLTLDSKYPFPYSSNNGEFVEGFFPIASIIKR